MQKGVEGHIQVTHNGFEQCLSNNVHKFGAFRRNRKIFSSVSGLKSKRWIL